MLTALAGEGGVGKTEIARKVAHDAHAGGTPEIWLERPDRELGGSLMAMIRQAVPEYRPPDTATIDDLRAHMRREIGACRSLLVLDDVEQAGAVATLTPGPAWNVLVTTRRRSLLPAVVELEVEPLVPDDAIMLLARVTQDGADFASNELEAARNLVVALGGLPLAIEIAGEVVRRGASLDEIRQATLASDSQPNDSIVGHVERVMASSLASLVAGDEAAWAMVAALPRAGATEQEVAWGLGEAEARAGRRLFRLRQANLLRFEPAQARYTMHPLSRQIARGRARAAGTWDATLIAAAKVVRTVMEWCVEPFGRDSEVAYRRWRARRGFLDTVDLTSWPPEAAGADDVAMSLGYADPFRAFELLPDERATLLEAAVIRARNSETLAQVHKVRGDLRRFRADLDGAEADYARALELFIAVQDNLGLAHVYKARGDLRRYRDRLDDAEADYARALELFTAVQSNLGLANVHQARGDLRRFRADLDGAEADYARAMELFTKVQSNLGLAQVHQARGDLRRFRDDIDGANVDYARALKLFTAVQDNLGLANVHKARGDLRRFRNDLDGADADFELAMELFTAVQNNLGLANVHLARGDLRRFRDDLDGAEADYARAMELFTKVQNNLGLANVHMVRGDLRRFRDDLDGADIDYARAMELFTEVQDNLGLGNVLQAQGDLYAGANALDRAEGFYLDALQIFERVQDSVGRSNVLADLAQTRARLGDRAGARAYALRAEPLAQASHNRYAMNVIARVLAWSGDSP